MSTKKIVGILVGTMSILGLSTTAYTVFSSSQAKAQLVVPPAELVPVPNSTELIEGVPCKAFCSTTFAVNSNNSSCPVAFVFQGQAYRSFTCQLTQPSGGSYFSNAQAGGGGCAEDQVRAEAASKGCAGVVIEYGTPFN